jgi:hypothetical protein
MERRQRATSPPRQPCGWGALQKFIDRAPTIPGEKLPWNITIPFEWSGEPWILEYQKVRNVAADCTGVTRARYRLYGGRPEPGWRPRYHFDPRHSLFTNL